MPPTRINKRQSPEQYKAPSMEYLPPTVLYFNLQERKDFSIKMSQRGLNPTSSLLDVWQPAVVGNGDPSTEQEW